MSNVISFLQALGEKAAMGEENYVAAIDAMQIDPQMRTALLARDQDAINRLLGGRGNVYSLLVPAEDDDKKDDEKDDDEQKEQIRVA